MTNGIGATIGTLSAQLIVNKFVFSNFRNVAEGSMATLSDSAREALAMNVWHGWQTSWFIFAAYAFVVAVLFALVFKYKHEPENKLKEEN